MKKLFSLSALLLCALFANAQMSDAEQKAMMEYGTPGKMHQMLAKDNGTWSEEISFWYAPGSEPMKYSATATNDMIMNGLIQQSRHAGSMMGMPFEGISTTAYDNVRNVFVNTWIDNFSSGIMSSEGKWNEAKKCIEFKGMVTDPVTKKLQPFRQNLTFVDDKHQKLEMYMMYKGKEYKSMEIALAKQ
jgi:hypothetical protein